MAHSSDEVSQFRNDRRHTSTVSPRTHCDLQSIRSIRCGSFQGLTMVSATLCQQNQRLRGEFDTRDRNRGPARRVAADNLSGFRR